MSYQPKLNLRETETAIKALKDFFEKALSLKLKLQRVSAPLFLLPETGLNDNLNGSERPVSFDIKETGCVAEIVHSLAKWKRYALARYGFEPEEGLYTDMNAIRRDEICDCLHSIYVDQYDWEKIILPQQRNFEYLKQSVCDIYETLISAEKYVLSNFPSLGQGVLPEKISFISSQELEDSYPALSAKEREYLAAKKYGAVFISQIGGRLNSGSRHDGRAPDYDDWSLNGDIILYYPELDIPLELSSMGIRVDAEALKSQLDELGLNQRLNFPYHKEIISGRLPLTIGGGIGQSRLCMFMLRKHHIGEVQASLWPKEHIEQCLKQGIHLL